MVLGIKPSRGEISNLSAVLELHSSKILQTDTYSSSLGEAQSALHSKEIDCLRMAEEIERTRTLEAKAFQEKEQLRSKLEEMYEERERNFQVC